MSKQYQQSLHIFRRDLRLADNSALIEALAQSERVIPCFIFDPRQIKDNPYKSNHCIQFMLRSLEELDAALREKQSQLYYFYGEAEHVIKQLSEELKIDAIFINRDYTPFSQQRDRNIATLCEKKSIAFHCHADALLHEPEQVLKADGTPYTVFTHAFKRAAQFAVEKTRKNNYSNYYQQPIALADDTLPHSLTPKPNPQLLVKGGRKEGRELLRRSLSLSNYADIRNIPSLNGTTLLSAHNKFGTLSIREIYHALVSQFGEQHTLITELYWRDFFTHIAYHFPRVFNGAFHEKYNKLPWRNNNEHFEAWRKGKTGYPIVDAGMRELNTTGFMHNRVRMITASFLVKDLRIDWRWGEKYFAQQLVDYDPAVNNGNWQWSASTGCDAQPYFRIFNPSLQQKKFDPHNEYIKKWLPEFPNNYFHPIVDHAIETCKTEALYREISQSN